jgi:hypothetical protein
MDSRKVPSLSREVSDTSSTSPTRFAGIRALIDAKLEAEVNKRVSRQIRRRVDAMDRHVKRLTRERDNLRMRLRSVRGLNRRSRLHSGNKLPA